MRVTSFSSFVSTIISFSISRRVFGIAGLPCLLTCITGRMSAFILMGEIEGVDTLIEGCVGDLLMLSMGDRVCGAAFGRVVLTGEVEGLAGG